MWLEEQTTVGQPALCCGHPRDTQGTKEDEERDGRDDLDSFVKHSLAPCHTKRRPLEDNGEGLCPMTDI